MFVPFPMILLAAVAFACCMVLLIVSEFQIKGLSRTFWQMSDNARQSQETALEAGRLAKEYEKALGFYAYEENWESMADSHGADGVPVCTTCAVVEDGGQIAIRALRGAGE